MTTLNLLKLRFDLPIQHRELQAFKAAFLQGLKTQIFSLEQYPLLQFKIWFQEGKFYPMLMVMGKKIATLHELLKAEPPRIRFRNRVQRLKISHCHSDQFPLRTDQGFHTYNLFKYQAFNQLNYQRFQALPEGEERRRFVEMLLREHLEAFVRGVGWTPDPPIVVKKMVILDEDIVSCPEYKSHCLDLRFRTNLWIPEHVGLGKRVSLGFGVLRLPRKKHS